MPTSRRKAGSPIFPRLILASASPRRAELLTSANLAFEVIVSPAEEPERKPTIIPIELWPACLAYMKAIAVQKKIGTRQSARTPSRLILAADTIVVDGNRILNKARTPAHARQMLLSLSGKTHKVVTGICLLADQHVRLSRAVATCQFKRLSNAALSAYIESNLWRGKAGAYGIQDVDPQNPFVTLVSGDVSTVLGLPIPLLLEELASFRKN